MHSYMDQRPIGIFDSGVGGLTMVKRLTSLLPGEDIIYLGDTGRVPYGSRSLETIVKYAGEDAAFLAGFGIKAMVVACNTACAASFAILEKKYSMPLYEVVKTPAKAAVKKTKNGKIGIIGTAATVRSGAYEKAIREMAPDISLYTAACPMFVPLVEEGLTSPDFEAAVLIARHYLTKLRNEQADTVILGCTHYSRLSDIITAVLGEDVTLVDSGAETAEFVADDLRGRGLLKNDAGADAVPQGSVKYYVTDSVEAFELQAAGFLGRDIKGMAEKVALET